MPEKQFTLFDLTFENSEFQFGPRAFPGGSDIKSRLTAGDGDATSADDDQPAADVADIDTDDEETGDADGTDGDDGRSRLGDLFRFALIGLLAIVAQRLLADDDEDGPQLDNVTDLGVVGRGSTDDESGDESDDETAENEADADVDDDAVSIDIEDGEADESSSEGRSMTSTILLLAVFVAVAVVAKKFLGADELEALDELDDVTAEP
jgi:hypothetical protein